MKSNAEVICYRGKQNLGQTMWGGIDDDYVPDHAASCKDKPRAHIIFSTDVIRSGLCLCRKTVAGALKSASQKVLSTGRAMLRQPKIHPPPYR